MTSSPFSDPVIPTVLHRSSGSRSSPGISFVPFSLALCCTWEVLQDLVSDHLPILLSVPLSLVFRPNERPPSFNFQKARWDDFDSHCPSAEKYSSLSRARRSHVPGGVSLVFLLSFLPSWFFLWLPPTFPHTLPRAQTKLPIPC